MRTRDTPGLKMADQQEPEQPATSVSLPFMTADDTSDVVFIVEGHRLYFNKTVLTMSSPVFAAMFKNKVNVRLNDTDELEVTGKTLKEMVTFYQQIHPAHASITPVTDEDLLTLLSLAYEYQVDHIKTKCQMYIDRQLHSNNQTFLSASKTLCYLTACEVYGLQESRETLIQLASKHNISSLQSTSFSERVPATALRDAVVRRCKDLERKNVSLRQEVANCQVLYQNVTREKAVLQEQLDEYKTKVTNLEAKVTKYRTAMHTSAYPYGKPMKKI